MPLGLPADVTARGFAFLTWDADKIIPIFCDEDMWFKEKTVGFIAARDYPTWIVRFLLRGKVDERV